MTCRFQGGVFQLAPIVTDSVTPQPVSFDCLVDDSASTVSALKKGMIALGTVLGVVLLLVVGILIFVRQYAQHYLHEMIQRHSQNTQGSGIPGRNAPFFQRIFRNFRRRNAQEDGLQSTKSPDAQLKGNVLPRQMDTVEPPPTAGPAKSLKETSLTRATSHPASRNLSTET